MRSESISVEALDRILEASGEIRIKDQSPRRMSERTARIMAEAAEEIPPEIVLRKKIELRKSIGVEDIREHLNDKYGAIAEPEITSVRINSASIGYDPEDYSRKADYEARVSWGHTPEAFGTEANTYSIGRIHLYGEEQDGEVIEALRSSLDLESVDDYAGSNLKRKLPRKEKYPRKLKNLL